MINCEHYRASEVTCVGLLAPARVRAARRKAETILTPIVLWFRGQTLHVTNIEISPDVIDFHGSVTGLVLDVRLRHPSNVLRRGVDDVWKVFVEDTLDSSRGCGCLHKE